MILRSLIRAAGRRWKLALSSFLATLLLGLWLVPGAPFAYTATARLILEPGDPVVPPAALERAGRSEPAVPADQWRPALRVRRAGDSVEVSCRATRPSKAVAMANAVARASLDVALEERKRRPAPHPIPTVPAPAGEPDPALRLSRARLVELEQARISAALELADLGIRIDTLSSRIERGEAGPTKALDTAESDRLSAEVDAARRRLDELRATYPDDWPPVARAAAQADELRARRDRALAREIQAARFAPVREQIEELRALTARRDLLKAEDAPREARIAELRRQPAPPPTPAVVRPSEPAPSEAGSMEPATRATLTGFALPILAGLGLLIGLAAAWTAEALATTVRTEHDVRRFVNLPLLGIVPFAGRAADRLLLSGEPQAPLAEPFNSAAALLETAARESSARLYGITSPSPGEGKSTVACNLALAMARGGSRVLLVDADLRRASQHKNFSLWNQAGLSSYLTGATDSIDGVIATTNVESLHLLLAGPVLDNPVPYLRSERFRALLPDLKGRYDLVLMDLPPVRSAADALLVAPLLDGILLVLSAPETRKDEAADAKRLLRAAGGKLSGCLLNKATVRSRGYYCYSPVPAGAAE